MNKVIIYQKAEGGIAIFYPAPQALSQYSLEAIAGAVVPEGVPYKIVNESDLPADREYREAWEISMVDPDGFGANYNTMDEV